jgi:hypothetical protein
MSAWAGPKLPTGTLTFLYTDVAGRRGPWEPGRRRAALRRSGS